MAGAVPPRCSGAVQWISSEGDGQLEGREPESSAPCPACFNQKLNQNGHFPMVMANEHFQGSDDPTETF